MVMDVITNSTLGPVMEIVSETVEAILELVVASDKVLIGRKSFSELSAFLVRIVPLLRELDRNNIYDSESLTKFLEILNHETKAAKKLIKDCSERNRFYLFLNCRSIAKRIEDINTEISRAMSCIPVASLNISAGIKEDIENLVGTMQNAEFRAAIAEEEILDKIESGIQERYVDRGYANNLLLSIAKAIGVSTDRSTLRKEFDEFRTEIENLRLRKDMAEAIQMDQIIALLERADAASSLEDREKKYMVRRESLGLQPLEPLRSFYCPITQDVMVDPVETPSGRTFEREAIVKWLSDTPMCPLTSTPLDTSMLRPNKTLRQSIEEWKERNIMIIIASLKSKLSSGEEEEVLCSLEKLKELCEEREIYREWLILENYIPTLIDLLRIRNRDIRQQALLILCFLAKDNDDVKERIAKVENSVEPIVQSLGRRMGEAKLAVALLLELSKSDSMCDCIGKVQGCVLLLVTMLNNADHQAARDAKNVLDNLSYSDDNVILMAKNNYFKYLLERLSSGTDNVKVAMAKTLAEMELTDHNKSSLVECGVLDLLIDLLSHDDLEMKISVIRALLNISSLKKNGQEVIKKGAVRPLLDILYLQTSSQDLRELVSETIASLALSSVPEDSGLMPVSMLESDEDIYQLFTLINLTGPRMQQNILQAFHAMCFSPSAATIKSKLGQCSAVPTLFRLCDIDDVVLRANAVKLLCCLTKDCDEAVMSEHVTQSSIETLFKIIKTSNNEEEIASALGAIANLPDSSQISDWLLESSDLSKVLSFLTNGKNSYHKRTQFMENAVGAISRLTVPTNLLLQKKVAETRLIPTLVNLLEVGSSSTRKRAAISLAQLSMSSPILTGQISRRHGFWCFSSLPESACPVHRGLCTVQSSFCLLEADAVEPLVRVLSDRDPDTCEAALDALLTLIDNERLQSGCKVLAEANAMPVLIRLISSPSVRLQEKVLNSLERIFRLVEYKQRFGPSAQMPLVDLTQRGSSSLKSLAAKILAQLNILHDQSSYF